MWPSGLTYHHYSFLLKADGKLNVIGSNVYGKLGLGDTVDRYSFNELKLSNVKEAITSTHTSIFLLKNGDVYGSGKNFYEYGPGNYYLIKENGEVTYNTPALLAFSEPSVVTKIFFIFLTPFTLSIFIISMVNNLYYTHSLKVG